MDLMIADFNGAEELMESGEPSDRWSELAGVLLDLPLHLQPSDQAQKIGTPIFDPKGTNAYLTERAAELGWVTVAVPERLTMFGNDWDGGKGSLLAEWQFSNYPFLWNNIIRTEAVFKGRVALAGMDAVQGLVVVTKTGSLPASNSTLYFEQALAQIGAVMEFDTFEVPIRLVGLTIEPDCDETDVVWTEYPDRYARQGGVSALVRMSTTWGRQSKYGNRSVAFS